MKKKERTKERTKERKKKKKKKHQGRKKRCKNWKGGKIGGREIRRRSNERQKRGEKRRKIAGTKRQTWKKLDRKKRVGTFVLPKKSPPPLLPHNEADKAAPHLDHGGVIDGGKDGRIIVGVGDFDGNEGLGWQGRFPIIPRVNFQHVRRRFLSIQGL